MDHKSVTPFKEVNPPENLKKIIISRVYMAERKSLRNRVLLFSVGTLASLVGVVYAATSLFQSFTQTGFSEYMSLVFSGDSSVLLFWKEISYSLVESMPVLGVAGFLVAVAFLVWLSANTVTNTRRFVWAA